MRGIKFEPGITQVAKPRRGIRVSLQLHPALGPLRRVVEPRKPLLSWNRVRFHDAHRIAGSNDSRHVMRFVNPLYKDGEIRLPARGDGVNSGFSFRGHGLYRMRFPKQTDTA